MRSRIFLKLLVAFAVVIAAAMMTINLTVRHAWENSLADEIQRNLTQKTILFAHRVDNDRSHSLQDIASEEGQAAGARATIIDHVGKVLADSEADPRTIREPARGDEVVAALRGSVSSQVRRNPTVGVPFLYVASPIAGGAVRLAYPLSDVEATTRNIFRTLLLGSAFGFAVALILAAIMAQKTSSRLAKIVHFADRVAAGDLAARMEVSSYDEIGYVARSLDRTIHRMEDNFAALQTSQRQLETLLNSMQDAVIAIGKDGRVLWANRGMERLVNRVRIGAPLIESVRDPDVVDTLARAADKDVVQTARAHSIVPGRTFDLTAAPMPGGGAVAVLRDLTESERIEKTRRDFIANVSHELRTPLTSIQGYAETLLDSGHATNSNREFLEIIRKNAARMARLTEDLLALARVESGEQRFDFQLTVPADLLDEVLQSFHERARAQRLELTVENEAAVPIKVDREAVHQVFANLVDNALKYAASGGRVVVGARPKNNFVEFYVRDFGPGISSEHLPRLFERFYRIDKARSRESGGTGLGLAIAKHIVLAHGGTIRAESELNHGTSFLFTFPIAPASQLQAR